MAEKKRLDVVDPRDVVVVVLGGGRGTRLYPLTRVRAKPAVNFGGKYRLVDIVMTNCLRSGLDKIYILTQFNSFSLNRHIWQTYSRFAPRESVIDVIAAERITRSIIGVRARIAEGCVIEDSILMGNDFAAGPVPFEIGRNCVTRRAILDKGVVLGDGSVIENAQGIEDVDRDLYSIHAGLVVIAKDTVLPPGTRI